MKIPPQAQLVFKGKIFHTYQWEQTMYDGSTATFEMLKRPDTVQVIPVVGDKIWLSFESQPNFAAHDSFLGGRVEEGEQPLSAAKRELLEESGLYSEEWDLIAVHEPFHKMEWELYYYIAKNCRKIQEPHLDAGENIEIRQYSFNEFVAKVTAKEFGYNQFSYELLQIKNNPAELQKLRARFYDKIHS
ncbi:MAG: NUDIX hydrolase [Patescibacteria group bacterium]|jgi:ADP-ribose pyrophosphatase